MATAQNKITPINIRALEGQRALIDKAASHLNKNRSEFMLEVACQEAINVLLDQRLFLGDGDTVNAFHTLLDHRRLTMTHYVNLLNHPPEKPDRMVDAAAPEPLSAAHNSEVFDCGEHGIDVARMKGLAEESPRLKKMYAIQDYDLNETHILTIINQWVVKLTECCIGCLSPYWR